MNMYLVVGLGVGDFKEIYVYTFADSPEDAVENFRGSYPGAGVVGVCWEV